MPLSRSQTVVSLAEKNDQLLALFKNLDTNGDGKIDAEEMSKVLAVIGLSHGAEAVKEAIGAADTDSDGYVEFDEFVVIMNRAAELKQTGSVAWNALWEERKTVLCWLSFPAAMVLLTAFGAIFSLRYITSITDALWVVNGIFDIVWKVTRGAGGSECPPSLMNCSFVNEQTHWPGAGALTANFEKNWFWLLIHVISVATAFMVFPFQFWKGLRSWSVENSNGVHKWMGRTAVFLLIVIAMPTSQMIATGPAGSGCISRLGFFGMALSVIATASKGWMCARKRNFAEHQKWMTRCFGALLGGFFNFRIGFAFLIWLPFNILWPIVCWGSWISGLLLAELYLRRTTRDQEKYLGIIAEGRAGHLAKSLRSSNDRA